jgi:hypothetical protein
VSAPPVAVDPRQLEAFVQAMFCHADARTWISLRAFRDDVDNAPPVDIKAVPMDGDLGAVTNAAVAMARGVAAHKYPVVFCAPICTLTNPDKADERSLANGLALSVELDVDAEQSRKRLEFLLGLATVVVASGGTWTDPKTGAAQSKLHVHWRLAEPTRDPEAHKRLKQARTMATALVGGDATNKPVVHPIRWPGSIHRKGEPKLCRIVDINPNAEIDLHAARCSTSSPSSGSPGRRADQRSRARTVTRPISFAPSSPARTSTPPCSLWPCAT